MSKNYETNRAIVHVGLSLILVWMLFYVKPIIVAPYLIAVLMLGELLRLKFKKFNHLITNGRLSIFTKVIRREEVNGFSSLSAFGLGFLLISWLSTDLVIIAVLINALADPAARIFGKRWGKKKILNTKNSFVGSSAFFATAFLISLIFLNPLVSLIAALAGTIAEFLPDKKPFWEDNLRILVFVGFVLWFMG